MQSVPSEIITLKRRRPALSCIECRRRKIKCDRREPCWPCVSADVPCAYRKRSKDSQRQQSPSCISTRNSVSASVTEYLRPATLHNASSGGGTGKASTPALDNNRAQSLGGTGKYPRLRGPVALNKTRIMMYPNVMTFITELQTVIAHWKCVTGVDNPDLLHSPLVRASIMHARDVLGQCKSLARRAKIERPSRDPQQPQAFIEQPSREMADRMAGLYINHYESVYRIVHIPTFWEDYTKYWAGPSKLPAGSRFIVLLVVAVGASLDPQMRTNDQIRRMCIQWIYAAQMWMSGTMEKDRLTLVGIQISCLCIIARQIYCLSAGLVWSAVGALLHQALQMGLHRDPEHFSSMSILEAETRRRLWATILELHTQAAVDAEMPSSIRFDEFDTKAPQNFDDNQLKPSCSETPPQPDHVFTSTSLQRMMLQSIRTRSRVLQSRSSLSKELEYSEVIVLSSDLSRDCEAAVKFACTEHAASTSAFQRTLLDYMLRRFLLHLHEPYSYDASTEPQYQFSRKASVEAAMALVYHSSDTVFEHLMNIGGGMFRHGLRNPGMILGLELAAQTHSQVSDMTIHRYGGTRMVLRKALERLVEVSAERIRQGELNVKNHMVLCMILAEAEAREKGASVDLSIARAASESLEYCLQLLQARWEPGVSDAWGDIGSSDLDAPFGDEGFDAFLSSFVPDSALF